MNTPNGTLNAKSSVEAVQKALQAAKTPAAKRELKALLKVVKRGGTGGTTSVRTGSPLSAWVVGTIVDVIDITNAIKSEKPFGEAYKDIQREKGPFVLTPIGFVPNPNYRETY